MRAILLARATVTSIFGLRANICASHEPLTKDEIICSCPIEQNPENVVGYQIVGPYPCQKSFFENCKKKTANKNTGSTLYVGAPTGTADPLAFLLTGTVPPSNRCFPPPN